MNKNKILIAVTVALSVGLYATVSDNINLKRQIATLQQRNEELLSELSETAAELTYVKDGAENLILEVRKAYEDKDYETVRRTAKKIHEDFLGTDEDIEAQSYIVLLDEIVKQEVLQKQEESRLQQKANSVTREEYVKGLLDITNISFEMDYLGGTDVHIDFVNKSDKTIKYIKFYCTPYNAVGDSVSCTLSNKSEALLKGTGPYEKGQSNSDNFWMKVWYNTTISKIDLTRIEIEYTDRTKETLLGYDVSLIY